jgi:hypothetical protein
VPNWRKTTKRKQPILQNPVAWCIVTGVLGVLVGMFIRRVPLVNFDPELNIGDFASALIALIGLATAVYIIPMLVGRVISNRDTTDGLIVRDLEEIYDHLRLIENAYRKAFDDNRALTAVKRGELLHDIKIASNLIKELSLQLNSNHADMDFDVKIKTVFSDQTYPLLTENLQVGQKVTQEQYLAASQSILGLTAEIKRCRYALFSK